MANLASVIMEGSGFGSLSVDLGNYDYSDTILAESSFINSAMATLFTDVVAAEQSYMVSDVVAAATYIHEASNGNTIDAYALLEASVGGAIDKIKNAFKKFINKIKEYYHKVIDWFKAMFSNAEKFVKNFGDTIKEKSRKVKGFKYEGFKYTISAGEAEVEKLRKAIDSEIKRTIEGFDFVANSPTSEDFKTKILSKLDVNFNEDDLPSSSEVVDEYIEKNLKYSDTTEMKSEVADKFRDDMSKKSTITDFEGNSVDSMIKFLKDSSSTISKLENQLSKYEENVKKVIKQLDKAENWETKGEGNDSANTAKVSHASYLSSIITGLLNTYKVPCEVEIQIKKDITKDWLGALKKFYNYRPAKESVEVYDAEAYATLENYIILEGGGNGDDDDEEVNESYGSDIADILDLASKYRF